MAEPNPVPPPASSSILYHYCRLQAPDVFLSKAAFDRHLARSFEIHAVKAAASWEGFFAGLHLLDWYLASACLENSAAAWDRLFAARASHSDRLLVDLLRGKAARFYPRDEERQETAVNDFWSRLLVSDRPESRPILARYDGQRPLAPWLLRVFQNWQLSQLRGRSGARQLVEEECAEETGRERDSEWHEVFRAGAREFAESLSEPEVLLLGLRVRYRLSQRDAAALLGVHEGTLSRQTSQLRDRFQEHLASRLRAAGWTGDDLEAFILVEMGSVLYDEPQLSGRHLRRLLAKRGLTAPRETITDSRSDA